MQACDHSVQAVTSQPSLFPSLFTAQALTNCDMYMLNAADFHQAAEEFPAVQAKLQAWALRSACCFPHTNTALCVELVLWIAVCLPNLPCPALPCPALPCPALPCPALPSAKITALP